MFIGNRYTYIRLFAPYYLWFILFIIYNNVYCTNLTVFRIWKTSFPIREVADSAMSHPQLPPNSAPEPPNFDRCGTPTSTFLPINNGGFETGVTVAFDWYIGLWVFYVVLVPTCHRIVETPVAFRLWSKRHGGRWYEVGMEFCVGLGVVRVEFRVGTGLWKCNAKSHFEWNQYVSTTEKYVVFWSIPLPSS